MPVEGVEVRALGFALQHPGVLDALGPVALAGGERLGRHGERHAVEDQVHIPLPPGRLALPVLVHEGLSLL